MVSDSVKKDIFKQTKTIAVVGFSSHSSRAGSYVPAFLHKRGYRIIPVNPKLSEGLGSKAYSNLESIPGSVDLVLVFRSPEAAILAIKESAYIGAKVVWLQEGSGSKEAFDVAEELGIPIIMDACMMRDYRRLMM